MASFSPAAGPLAIETHRLGKHYPQAGADPLVILEACDFQIARGEMVALVGPSGAGKSTLLHVLGLLDRPTSGELLLFGQPMQRANDRIRTSIRNRDIGFVYQFHHLLPDFGAEENVAMPALIAGMSKREARDRAWQLLEHVGLGARRFHRPGKLSGGEQQRAAIARALVNAPRLLLADEPTGNLDATTGAVVFDLLAQLVRASGLTALIATHNRELAARMDRAITLAEGAVVPYHL